MSFNSSSYVIASSIEIVSIFSKSLSIWADVISASFSFSMKSVNFSFEIPV